MNTKELMDGLEKYSSYIIEADRLYTILEMLDQEKVERIANSFTDTLEFLQTELEEV